MKKLSLFIIVAMVLLTACAPKAAEMPAVRSVLVKGSRFMRMERVVSGLQALDTSASTQTSKDVHAA